MASQKSPNVITINGRRYRDVKEGLACVLAPYSENEKPIEKGSRNNDEGNQSVFYNPIQQFNRDLTVLAILIYGEGAILQKEAKSQQGRSHKGRKPKSRPHKAAGGNVNGGPDGVLELNTSSKRKSDDLEGDVNEESTTVSAKKQKTSEHLDHDEELPVVEPSTLDNVDEDAGKLDGRSTNDQKGAAGGNENVDAVPLDPPTLAQSRRKAHFSILDALSATGLRALRYAKEIPFATHIVANDLSPESVAAIETNTAHNDVRDKVFSNLGDARAFMYSKVGNERPTKNDDHYVHRFDVVDLDPYGTAAPFLDAALSSIQDGGMLCVTCTDAGVFASAGYPEKTYALYGGTPLKGPHSHEGGLRLILNAVATSAAKYGLAIEPLLSLNIDYYARVFVRVHRKQHEVKLLAGTTMVVYNCAYGCGSWTTQPLLRNQENTAKNGDTFYKFSFAQAPTTTPNCEHCGSRMHLCGPMWAGPLHHPYFVQRMLDRIPSLDRSVYGTADRLEGMLTLALEEDLSLQDSGFPDAPRDADSKSDEDPRVIPRLPPKAVDSTPFFFLPTQLAKVIHCATPSEDTMRGALLSLGYRVSRSHCKPGSIKTNAPWSVLWEIIREFMRQKAPIKDGAVKKGSPGWNILSRARGTERAFVQGVKDVGMEQLEKCESKQDMKTVLQGLLWRLENEKQGEGDGGAGAPAGQQNGDATATGVVAEGKRDASPTRKQRGLSPAQEASKIQLTFNEKLDWLGREKPRKLVRYQMNPRENWGPMTRAGRGS